MRIRTILVPTDFSEPAHEARRHAEWLAGQFNSRLHLLHVVTPPVGWGADTVPTNMTHVLAETEALAVREMERHKPRRGAFAGRVVTAAVTGFPVEEILEYIARHRIDLVVIGTHGRGLVAHLLLGSIAERVVQRSPVPVLTVHGRPPARARARPVPEARRARRGQSGRR